ncbi:PEP-CTERM sorting domain-containing protein [Reinekea marinisedimentorum]|uniref:Putative secreted protein with PEP-CTERM sorting signal n=1 Tax=Reinekea marinisedimentorum TaxID=230495 RepID=A0A4R3I5V7_9GAMM|nr:PEP-CTERM sorting domain-containing protein [Reinekea marinisedimentorum]TCS41078.1 putative secreted protein with PEP-CTERM sorting signal [Reinekea marinisedimentorum]
MNLKKTLLLTSAALFSASSYATVLTFNSSSETVADELTFTADSGVSVTVSSGVSYRAENVASVDFDLGSVTTNDASNVYQGILGLGATSTLTTTNGCNSDSNAIDQNLRSCSGGDEILFFDFSTDVTLDTVWFTEVSDGTSNNTTLYNIFYSTDGYTYTSVFDATRNGLHQYAAETDGSLSTLISATYEYWAVAVTGWNDADGAYINAIEFTVPEPATLALLALGLGGIVASRRKVKSSSAA